MDQAENNDSARLWDGLLQGLSIMRWSQTYFPSMWIWWKSWVRLFLYPTILAWPSWSINAEFKKPYTDQSLTFITNRTGVEVDLKSLMEFRNSCPYQILKQYPNLVTVLVWNLTRLFNQNLTFAMGTQTNPHDTFNNARLISQWKWWVGNTFRPIRGNEPLLKFENLNINA